MRRQFIINQIGNICNVRATEMRNFVGFCVFQAEDGIRDLYVTGVQTCALPISPASGDGPFVMPRGQAPVQAPTPQPRSEERRVGKECRSRWPPYHQKKKEEESLRTYLVSRSLVVHWWMSTSSRPAVRISILTAT